jgi:hypothetical protein
MAKTTKVSTKMTKKAPPKKKAPLIKKGACVNKNKMQKKRFPI